MLHIICHQGNAKLKQQWDMITQLLDWPKSKTLTIPNAVKDAEQQKLSFMAAGDAKWHSYFGEHFGGFL